MINAIIGGHDGIDPKESTKRQRSKEAITFSEEDTNGVQFLYNDVIVVSLNVANYDVRRILVDNGSSADTLFYDAFSKIKISLDWLGRLDSPL